jgi:lysophospholipase L1-like esterase
MCACYAGHAAVTGPGGLRAHVDEGGAQVVADVNDVPVADVYDAFGGEHDKLCTYTYMRTAPLHVAADIHPTTKGYSVIASARKTAAEDRTVD